MMLRKLGGQVAFIIFKLQ